MSVQYDRWHATAQYHTPPTPEMADTLPPALAPIRSEAEMPDFYRHPRINTPIAAGGAAGTSAFSSAVADQQHQSTGAGNYVAPSVHSGETNGEVAASSAHVDGPERGPGSTFGIEWNNYLSWGVDAQVQSDFHDKREGCRECFCCRPMNMCCMGMVGAANFCCCRARTLEAEVEIRDDEGRWTHVPLPPGLRSIVLLNTPTYAGGRFLWGKSRLVREGDAPSRKKARAYECATTVQQRLDDGLFEIVGVKDMLHLGLVMMGVSRGIRLAQVSEARLTFLEPCYAQVDGEPYHDMPATYHIRPLQPATIITRPDKVVSTIKH
jgi:hypothetical protein